MKALWLEVGQARLRGEELQVVLKADRGERGDGWEWHDVSRAALEGSDSPDKMFRRIVEWLDKKKPVVAGIEAEVAKPEPTTPDAGAAPESRPKTAKDAATPAATPATPPAAVLVCKYIRFESGDPNAR